MDRMIKRSIAIVVALALCFTMTAAFSTVEVQAASKTHLKKSSITLTIGKSYSQKLLSANGKTISASKVTWKSTNKSVATVSKKGVVKAKKVGKATIKAIYKGKTYKCKCTVKRTPEDQAYYVLKEYAPALDATTNALYDLLELDFEGSVFWMFTAIEHIDEAIQLCEGYDELQEAKRYLESMNAIFKDTSFYRNGKYNVDESAETLNEIVDVNEKALPIGEALVEELKDIMN